MKKVTQAGGESAGMPPHLAKTEVDPAPAQRSDANADGGNGGERRGGRSILDAELGARLRSRRGDWTLRAIADEYGFHIGTVGLWVRRGVKVCGHTVRLEARRIGGRWRVADEALALFIARCTGADRPPDKTDEGDTARRRRERRCHERALAACGALGLF